MPFGFLPEFAFTFTGIPNRHALIFAAVSPAPQRPLFEYDCLSVNFVV